MTTLTVNPKNVNIIEYAKVESAYAAAVEESANTGGIHLPGIFFQQGARYCVATAFSVPRVRSRLEVNSAPSRGTVRDVLNASNRPVIADHVNNIAEYLKDNVGKRYILPPMTLNVQLQQRISVHMASSIASAHFGIVYIVVPETARLSITDGGHRAQAITKASGEMSAEEVVLFDRDAVAVMITLEGDVQQVHQDFADCSKSKSLPKSQLAAYDRRNPANGLVLDIIERCPLFTDKIDSTSKTLSKLSAHLFLTNQVRQLVKELLVGDYALADDQFEQKAKDLLVSNDDPKYAAERDRFVGFVNTFAEKIPVLDEIAKLPAGTPRNKIKVLRAEGWICLTATGMVIIGRVGHELFRDQVPKWEEYVERLGAINWARNGELWQGNIVGAGKMATQRAPVRVAVEKVRRAIGLPPNRQLDNELEGRSDRSVNPPLAPAA